MRTKNHVSLIGMVGKDAELRTTQAGVPYARFTIATCTGGYKKNDGTDVPEVTQWHNVVCWRNLATAVGKIIKKGMKVDVEGMITYGQYQDQQGQQRLSVEIVADDIVLMTNPNPNRSQAQGQQSIPAQQQQPAPMPQGGYQPQQQYQAQPAPPQQGYVQQNSQPMPQGFGAPSTAPSDPDDLPFLWHR